MNYNPVQFAVVREDPLIEAGLIQKFGAERVLLIGSGGCTALTLQAMFPHLSLTVVDPNPAQIGLIQTKIERLQKDSPADRRRSFNIDVDDPKGLNACGNFESLFRSFRRFLNEFVISDGELREALGQETSLSDSLGWICDNKYWKVAFDLHFNNDFLEAMFGPAAVQHAPKESYVRYFRDTFEKCLLDEDPPSYFFDHVFLGCYREKSLPSYLTAPVPDYNIQFVTHTLEHVPDLGSYDLVSLSNIFDWMSNSKVLSAGRLLGKKLKHGSHIVFRQLNHREDFNSYFRHFRFDPHLGEDLRLKDRSRFYSKINVARKMEE